MDQIQAFCYSLYCFFCCWLSAELVLFGKDLNIQRSLKLLLSLHYTAKSHPHQFWTEFLKLPCSVADILLFYISWLTSNDILLHFPAFLLKLFIPSASGLVKRESWLVEVDCTAFLADFFYGNTVMSNFWEKDHSTLLIHTQIRFLSKTKFSSLNLWRSPLREKIHLVSRILSK